ncbi:Uncharacterised protein [Burkholderia pseudomallei]|nr:Uncharacterised protein [Burkholderia pseudomallei]CAJ7616697.1 Uncharacterised protein [Burkholderia pseudomallei]
MRAQQRAQLTRDLKKAVAVELRGDALGVDAELRQYEEIRDLLETGVSKSVIVEMPGNHGMSISDPMDEEFLAPK